MRRMTASLLFVAEMDNTLIMALNPAGLAWLQACAPVGDSTFIVTSPREFGELAARAHDDRVELTYDLE